MSQYTTNEFKSGLKVMLDGDPCRIIENTFIKPGKGQAFNRVKLRNLKTGRVLDRTFKSGESIPSADVSDVEAHYLYADGQSWHFMAPDTYEQYAAEASAVEDVVLWLKEQDLCILTLFNGGVISVEPPTFVHRLVVETDPGMKGDTASGGNKPAKVETGAVVKVPLFVAVGDVLKIDTRTGQYVSRGAS